MRSEIKILGHIYNISMRENMRSSGKSCLVDLQIYLDEDQSDSQMIATLLHECIEMINAQLELSMEHSQICGIETGIYQVMTEAGIDLTPLVEGK